MKQAVDLPELWTATQLAEYLGVGRRFVYRLTEERRIPFCKMGGELRFRAADVVAFVEASMTPARSEHVERRGRNRSPYSTKRRK